MKINDFRSDLTDVSAIKKSLVARPDHHVKFSSGLASVFLFSKLINLFFGYFDPVNIFFDNKNK